MRPCQSGPLHVAMQLCPANCQLLQVLRDASRMAQGGKRGAALPSGTPGGASSSGGRTPTAHPERYGGQELDYASYEAGAAAGAAGTPATSVLSTSSFSPPQPLVLLAVWPLGRVSEAVGVATGRRCCLGLQHSICSHALPSSWRISQSHSQALTQLCCRTA